MGSFKSYQMASLLQWGKESFSILSFQLGNGWRGEGARMLEKIHLN